MTRVGSDRERRLIRFSEGDNTEETETMTNTQHELKGLNEQTDTLSYIIVVVFFYQIRVLQSATVLCCPKVDRANIENRFPKSRALWTT